METCPVEVDDGVLACANTPHRRALSRDWGRVNTDRVGGMTDMDREPGRSSMKCFEKTLGIFDIEAVYDLSTCTFIVIYIVLNRVSALAPPMLVDQWQQVY